MLKKLITGSVAALLALPLALVSEAQAQTPPVTIKLGARHGHGVPIRQGCNHVGGGNIIVEQPTPDTVVITLGGTAVAYGSPFCGAHAGFNFDVSQCFEVVFESKDVKAAKLIMEGRLVGLLRSHCKGGGTASSGQACASIAVNVPECSQEITSLCLPPHSVACGENLSINDAEGPVCVPILPGCYTLHQVFTFSACMPKSILPCKAPSAEFAPDALDPLWIDYKEPFYGADKTNYGFQVTIRVEETDAPAPEAVKALSLKE